MGFLAYTKINPFAAAQGTAFSQSPRSPNANPFSTTSPKSNPFMSFVEKKDEYWNMMSTNPSLAKTSSIFGFNSDTVQNTIINSRSDAKNSHSDLPKSKKDSIFTNPTPPPDAANQNGNNEDSDVESDVKSTVSDAEDEESPSMTAQTIAASAAKKCLR